MSWYKRAATENEVKYLGWVNVDSSCISAIRWTDLTQPHDGSWGVLDVTMKPHKEDGKERTYSFMGVPEHVYKAFLLHPSKGIFFNQVIKNKYSEKPKSKIKP